MSNESENRRPVSRGMAMRALLAAAMPFCHCDLCGGLLGQDYRTWWEAVSITEPGHVADITVMRKAHTRCASGAFVTREDLN